MSICFIEVNNNTTSDVVEAHATALNWTGMLLSNHIARGEIAVRRFELDEGLRVSHKV